MRVIEGTQLEFARGPVFVVEEENDPCMNAAEFIASKQDGDVISKMFVKAALHLRGLVGTIKQGGPICVGDLCKVVYPDPSA